MEGTKKVQQNIATKADSSSDESSDSSDEEGGRNSATTSDSGVWAGHR